METPDRLRTQDMVRVTIINTQDHTMHTLTADGFHDIMEAIERAWADWTSHTGDIRDYAFQVDDLASGVSHRYRINAHGNLHLDV